MADQEFRDFLTQIITRRIDRWAEFDFVVDGELDAEIRSYIVRQPQPNNDGPSNSLDSLEDMEFSDACSDMPPSTSSTHLMQATSSESRPLRPAPVTNQIRNNNQESIDWQTVVPNEWVCSFFGVL